MGTAFNSQTSRRARSGDIPYWDAKLGQWTPKGIGKIEVNGTVIPSTLTQTKSESVVSTGATGPYTITFPTAFVSQPVVNATIGLAAGNFAILNISSVTTTTFVFSMAYFTPGLVVIPAATSVLIEWIAIGT